MDAKFADKNCSGLSPITSKRNFRISLNIFFKSAYLVLALAAHILKLERYREISMAPVQG